MDNSENAHEKLVRLTKSLNIGDLVSGKGCTFEVNFENHPEEEEFCYKPTEAYKFSNADCLGMVDEDTYTDGEPFEALSSKMKNVLEDGAIKKRILREGYGDVLPDKATVTIHYNAYMEYYDEPFDSTYLRKKPFTFTLNVGATIPGLDIATQTMKASEKSQFIVKPELAYGPMGCLQRVPPNSTILYEVEVVNYVDAGATISYPSLPENEQRFYSHIEKYASGLCAKANEMYKKGCYKAAIKAYNTAVGKLENCTLLDYKDQEKQQELLLRLLTNLVVTYTKMQEPRRACANCNKIYYICKGTSLKIPAKVFFNHGRSLILLADYDWAEKKLKLALRLEPQNTEITNELLKLDQKKKESYNRQLMLARAMFKSNETTSKIEISSEFKESITAFCKELLEDNDTVQYKMPENLTEKEMSFCRAEVAKHGLQIISKKDNNIDTIVIAKMVTATEA